MKTYEPRRNNECPNGLHADYDPAKDPTQNECTCPWLIIQSSTPVQHLTSWNRRETENVIREMDRGYFDPPGYPRRTGSMFLSPAMQRLLDVAEKSPVAAALTLLAGSGSGLPPFDAIAWDAEDAVLSVRVGGGGWWHLFLGTSNVEAVTNHDDAHAAGANPVLLWADHPDTARETALPKLNAAWHHEECACDLNDPQQQAGCQRADEFSAAYLPEAVSDDVYAEGEERPARIMGDYMPVILEVPAADVDNMTAGNPVFDAAMEQARSQGDGGVLILPEELTFPPLPQRVPQVPSSITRGGVRFPTDVPEDVFHAAQAGVIGDESSCPNCGQFLTAAEILGDMTTHDCAPPDQTCICDIRGSAPDTYNCPEHPTAVERRAMCANDTHPEGHFVCQLREDHEGWHADGSTKWEADWHMS